MPCSAPRMTSSDNWASHSPPRTPSGGCIWGWAGGLLSAPNVLRQGPSPPSPGEGTPNSLTLPHHPPPDLREGGHCLALQTRGRAWQCCVDHDTVRKGGQERVSRKVGLERCLRGFSSSSWQLKERTIPVLPPKPKAIRDLRGEMLLPPSPTNH